MSRPKIIALVGGIGRDSINQKLFGFFREESKELLDFDQFGISALPYFSQDLENDPPPEAAGFKKRVRESDGALFVTPEYNRSFPGVLKNAIDWASRPYGQNLWSGKPAYIIGTTPGAIGTFGAQSQLRGVLAFLDLKIMNQPECCFTFPKELTAGRLPEPSREFLKMCAAKFAQWVSDNR
ncbi:MAG: NAD(P)H-dependent oxidoreductase [Synergistaceae bacterium]|nr:NAD(P)H-dependent oxidoreductase [Synergistaceae bacterium]